MSESVGNGLKVSENVGNERFDDDSDLFEMSESVGNGLKMSENVGTKTPENSGKKRGQRVGEGEMIMTANGLKSFDEFRSWIKLSYSRRNREGSSETLELRRNELEAHIRASLIGDNLKRFVRQSKEVVGLNIYNLVYKNGFVRLSESEIPAESSFHGEWNIAK